MAAVTYRPTTRSCVDNYDQDRQYLQSQRATNPITERLLNADGQYGELSNLEERVKQESIGLNEEVKRAAEYEKASKKHALIRTVAFIAVTVFVAYLCYEFKAGYQEDVSKGYEYGKAIINETVRNISSWKNSYGIISEGGKRIAANFSQIFANCSLTVK